MPEFLSPQQPDLPEQRLAPWSVLVVDDDEGMHAITRLLLKNLRFDDKPLQIASAYSKAEAQQLLTSGHGFSVLIVDVVMESLTAGLELVQWVREQLGDKKVRLLLRTGQPGDMPELAVMQQYEINDYINKIDCTNTRLTCALVAALRARREMDALAYEQQLHTVRDLMLSHLGHQVRTPLHAILGNAALGLAQAPDLQLTGYFRQIQQSARQLQGVFDDLLDFACLRQGKLPLAPSGCRPAELIDLLQSQFRHGPQQHSCQLHTQVSAEVPAGIWVDQARLQQIISNLLSNALHATPKGQIWLTVQMSVTALQQPAIRFVVKDNGCGLSPELASQIRRQWQQGWKGIEIRGIGLYISYQLAELMGGRLDFVSDSQGSEFFLELPCQRWDGSQSAPPQTAVQPHNGSGARILVVDDSAVNLEIACAVLQNAGFTADGASDGLTAISMLRQSDYAAVLMDIQMPELDGFATTARIRQLPAGADVPIIAITAHALAGYREQCLACGMNDYLTKPVDADTLIQTIRRWVVQDTFDPAAVAPTGPVTTNEMDILSEEAALRRLGGNRSLLASLLQEFIATSNPARPACIAAALASDDVPQALRLVHRLKGESGTLAALKLQHCAAVLEQQLQQKSPWHSALQQLEQAFAQLSSLVQQSFVSPAGTPDLPTPNGPTAQAPAANHATPVSGAGQPATDWVAVTAGLKFSIAETLLWRQLDQLLNIQSLEAELVLQQLQQSAATVLQPGLQEIARALQSFDFQQARQLCRQIAGAAL